MRRRRKEDESGRCSDCGARRRGAKDSPFGYIPSYEDIDFDGLDFTKEQFDAVMAIDPKRVKELAEANTDYLKNTIGHASPELLAVSDDIISRCK